MSKNNLADLNNHLFGMLEKLCESDLVNDDKKLERAEHDTSGSGDEG